MVLATADTPNIMGAARLVDRAKRANTKVHCPREKRIVEPCRCRPIVTRLDGDEGIKRREVGIAIIVTMIVQACQLMYRR